MYVCMYVPAYPAVRSRSAGGLYCREGGKRTNESPFRIVKKDSPGNFYKKQLAVSSRWGSVFLFSFSFFLSFLFFSIPYGSRQTGDDEGISETSAERRDEQRHKKGTRERDGFLFPLPALPSLFFIFYFIIPFPEKSPALPHGRKKQKGHEHKAGARAVGGPGGVSWRWREAGPFPA